MRGERGGEGFFCKLSSRDSQTQRVCLLHNGTRLASLEPVKLDESECMSLILCVCRADECVWEGCCEKTGCCHAPHQQERGCEESWCGTRSACCSHPRLQGRLPLISASTTPSSTCTNTYILAYAPTAEATTHNTDTTQQQQTLCCVLLARSINARGTTRLFRGRLWCPRPRGLFVGVPYCRCRRAAQAPAAPFSASSSCRGFCCRHCTASRCSRAPPLAVRPR